MRDSFVFYRSFHNALSKLSDADRLAAYDALVEYGLDGLEDAEGVSAAILEAFKPLIDANNRRYENGKKGGRPTSENQDETKPKPNHNQTIITEEPNHNLNEKCEMRNEKCEKVKDKREGRMTRPTLEELRAFCKDHKLKTDPEAFFAYYESNGWKVGKNPMKDWKAALRTWEKRETARSGTSKARKPSFSDQRSYDYGELESRLLGGGAS